jgi:hypothetical protein
MGMLHGAAGTAAFVGEALVAVSQTYLAVFLYTLFFSIGVLVAMALYAGALGGLIDWGGRRFRTVMVGAQALTGILAVWWVTAGSAASKFRGFISIKPCISPSAKKKNC